MVELLGINEYSVVRILVDEFVSLAFFLQFLPS